MKISCNNGRGVITVAKGKARIKAHDSCRDELVRWEKEGLEDPMPVHHRLST